MALMSLDKFVKMFKHPSGHTRLLGMGADLVPEGTSGSRVFRGMEEEGKRRVAEEVQRKARREGKKADKTKKIATGVGAGLGALTGGLAAPVGGVLAGVASGMATGAQAGSNVGAGLTGGELTQIANTQTQQAQGPISDLADDFDTIIKTFKKIGQKREGGTTKGISRTGPESMGFDPTPQQDEKGVMRWRHAGTGQWYSRAEMIELFGIDPIGSFNRVPATGGFDNASD